MINTPLRRRPVQTPGVAGEAHTAEVEAAAASEAAAPEAAAPEIAAPEVAAPEAAAPEIAAPEAAAAESELETVAVDVAAATDEAPIESPALPAPSAGMPVAPANGEQPTAPAIGPDQPRAQSKPAPDTPSRDSPFIASLAGTIAVIPMVAIVAAVVVYVVGGGDSTRVLVGTASLVGAALIWALVALATRRFAAARFANSGEYGQLQIRLEKLKAWLDTMPREDEARPKPYPDALAEATGIQTTVQEQLSSAGLPWVLGTGYINAWMALHRAEEARLLLQSKDATIADGLYDELRLEGSQIAHADELLTKVRQAVAALSGAAADLYLGTKVPAPASSPAGDAGPDAEVMARNALRMVRRTINEYRDELWEGLVRARNQLVKTTVFTGTAAYLLLLILVVNQVSPHIVLTASVLFLVGSLVGLMARLRAESAAGRAVEDFGLASARLVSAPLFSGLAATIGVLIVGLAHLSVGSISLGPAPAAGAAVPSLGSIFSLASNPIGLLAAALFGLTPGLLLDYLQFESNQLKQGLKSSEASGQTTPKA